MTFNKCSINGIVYGNQEEVNYGVSDDMIKVLLMILLLIIGVIVIIYCSQ